MFPRGLRVDRALKPFSPAGSNYGADDEGRYDDAPEVTIAMLAASLVVAVAAVVSERNGRTAGARASSGSR